MRQTCDVFISELSPSEAEKREDSWDNGAGAGACVCVCVRVCVFLYCKCLDECCMRCVMGEGEDLEYLIGLVSQVTGLAI